jgi:pilus assembly protein Flp/PilA
MIIQFLNDESGVTAVEYSLLAALVGIVAIAAFRAFGASMADMYDVVSVILTDSVRN